MIISIKNSKLIDQKVDSLFLPTKVHKIDQIFDNNTSHTRHHLQVVTIIITICTLTIYLLIQLIIMFQLLNQLSQHQYLHLKITNNNLNQINNILNHIHLMKLTINIKIGNLKLLMFRVYSKLRTNQCIFLMVEIIQMTLLLLKFFQNSDLTTERILLK